MRTTRMLLLAIVFGITSACSTLPFDFPREESYSVSPNEDTRLRELTEDWLAENDGPNGVVPLVAGNDAFGARLRLLELAEKSVDAQYFLMKGDSAGRVFTGALLAAADRGVRIRFLIDDVFTSIDDEILLLIDAHPNIQVRLHNPISRRGFYFLNYLAQFSRANRRMHNKSFTADNQMTIVGGRNIADEYFELSPDGEFLDLDVLAIGPVAQDVSKEFDNYWNHERSLPIAAVKHKFTEEELAVARAEVDEEMRTLSYSLYQIAINSQLLADIASRKETIYSAPIEVISDAPEKLDNPIGVEHMLLVARLDEILRAADSEVVAITPYLVPGKDGVEYWRRLVDSGVRVVLITNSMASNNHVPVHSAYMRYRKALIDAGVELYEARVDAVKDPTHGSKMTLHTKAMLIDRSKIFVGSLNLDPRSIEINSEMGIVVESAELGKRFADDLFEQLPNITYRVEMDEKRRLQWRGIVDGVEVVETKEPQAGFWLKFKAWIMRIAPERQL